MKKSLFSALPSALALACGLAVASPAMAAGGGGKLKAHDFPFEGVFGHWDQGALQRGFLVYKDVCASCHGLQYVSFRSLAVFDQVENAGGAEEGPLFAVAQMKAVAAEFEVFDPELEPGETRPGKISDNFPAVSGEGMGPDLSLMAKARAGKAAHIYSILTSYTGEEHDGLYHNEAFAGGMISMAPPLEDELVEYTDGTPMTAEQYAHDVSSFLAYAAEPKMMSRKKTGIMVVGYLILITVLLWFCNRAVWWRVKHPDEE